MRASHQHQRALQHHKQGALSSLGRRRKDVKKDAATVPTAGASAPVELREYRGAFEWGFRVAVSACCSAHVQNGCFGR